MLPNPKRARAWVVETENNFDDLSWEFTTRYGVCHILSTYPLSLLIKVITRMVSFSCVNDDNFVYLCSRLTSDNIMLLSEYPHRLRLSLGGLQKYNFE